MSKDTNKDKDKDKKKDETNKPGGTPPPSPPGTSAPPAGEPAPGKPARTRASQSMERRLALALVAILAETDKAKLVGPAFDAGRLLVKDVNEKVVKPITERIAVLKAELAAAQANLDAMDYGKIASLAKELGTLQGKLKAIQSPAPPTPPAPPPPSTPPTT